MVDYIGKASLAPGLEKFRAGTEGCRKSLAASGQNLSHFSQVGNPTKCQTKKHRLKPWMLTLHSTLTRAVPNAPQK